jgi:pimeloyl-ACP methyl ester carboxylesterase
VLVFEGPGQGEALIVRHLTFRPDFENVLTPVIDWLEAQPEDPGPLILFGRSFAGYLAPRAATREHRLAALVCDPAQPDMAAHLPKGVGGKVAGPAVSAMMRVSRNRAEFFRSRMATHGVTDPGAYFAELRAFTMLDDAGLITCPTLLVESEHDPVGGGGPVLYDALTCPKELVRLTAAQGVDGHCGGLGQQVWADTVYGWLDRQLAARPVAA